jgi:hypothetical protein
MHCVPTISSFPLNVTMAGRGHGTVTSAPAGIDCGMDCSEEYQAGTLVTLTATNGEYSEFEGWSGDCTGTGTCTVTMDQAKNVTATFRHDTFPLTVTFAGDGFGTISSEPIGFVNCSFNCFTAFDVGTEVYLMAHPGMNNEFEGWSGDCTGTGTCTVTMDQAKNVTATFRHYINLFTSIYNVTDGSGEVHGTISLSPSNAANCVAYDWQAGVKHCEAVRFYPGVKVTLTATPGSGHMFTGYQSTNDICVLVPNNDYQCQFSVTDSTPDQIYVNAYFSP